MLSEEQILWDVVEEHLDEAEFLVGQWRSARVSAMYTLEELRDGPEQRLLGHVDGLVVNGPTALERVAWPVVRDGGEPTLVAAAALALLDSGDFAVLTALEEEPTEPEPEDEEAEGDAEEEDDDDAMPEELEALDREALNQAAQNEKDGVKVEGIEGLEEDEDDGDDDEQSEPPPLPDSDDDAPPPVEDTEEPEADPRAEGLGVALALGSHPKLNAQIQSQLAKAEGPTLTLLLHACADRGLDAGRAIDAPIVAEEPAPLVAALRAAAHSDKRRLLAAVESRLQHPNLAVRLAALDTAMRWGSAAGWQLASYAYKQPHGRDAMLWVACLGDDRHTTALVPLLDDDTLRHDALWALGFSGRIPAVEACLPLLDDDDDTTRRLAGEALTAILGLDLEDEALWDEENIDAAAEEEGIAGDDPSDDEDDLEADLAGDPADDLPLPNAEAIRAWWEAHRSAFTPGQRYLLGKPVGKEGPGWALSMQPCRRVDVIAREIVGRSQGVGRWPARVDAPRHIAAAGTLAKLGEQAGIMQGNKR